MYLTVLHSQIDCWINNRHIRVRYVHKSLYANANKFIMRKSYFNKRRSVTQSLIKYINVCLHDARMQSNKVREDWWVWLFEYIKILCFTPETFEWAFVEEMIEGLLNFFVLIDETTFTCCWCEQISVYSLVLHAETTIVLTSCHLSSIFYLSIDAFSCFCLFHQ